MREENEADRARSEPSLQHKRPLPKFETPSEAEIEAAAADLGLPLSRGLASTYAALIGATVDAYRRVTALHCEASAPARDWHRPEQGEDPCNAYAVLMDFRGAESGPLSGYKIAVKTSLRWPELLSPSAQQSSMAMCPRRTPPSFPAFLKQAAQS